MPVRMMTVRMIITLGAASSALITATPALAQQEIPYDERVYEYGQPVVQGEIQDERPVVFRSDPVVQPIAQPQPVIREEESIEPVRTVRYIKGPAYQARPVQTLPVQTLPVQSREVEYVEPVAASGAVRYVQPAQQIPHTAPYPAAHPQQHTYAQPAPAYATPAYAPAQRHAGYDREAWLDECRDRIRGRQRGSNGGIIGGLLGAIAGGVAGNRIFDSERLAGTLIGGGFGGLAGLAIGSLIGGRDRGRDIDECEDYLTRWEYQQQQRYQGGYQGAYGYQQGYTQGYMMVPVTVAIPQRAVVREYVTTEIVTEYVDVETTEPVRRRVITRPVPVKRQRYIKGQ